MANSPITTNDIWNDVEFELMQGTLQHSTLAGGIQALKGYINKIRSTAFGAGAGAERSSLSGVLNQQFQVIDLLLSLVEQLAQEVRAARQAAKAANLLAGPPPPSSADQTPAEVTATSPSGQPASVTELEVEDNYWWPPAEVEKAMQTEALWLGYETRPSSLPLVGERLTRLRQKMHSLPLFYVSRMAGKQSLVNQTFGEWILHVNRLQHHQAEEIKSLKKELAELNRRVLDSASGRPATPPTPAPAPAQSLEQKDGSSAPSTRKKLS